MSEITKEKRQEPGCKATAWEKQEDGTYTRVPVSEYDFEKLYDECDSLVSVLLDSPEPENFLAELIKVRSKMEVGPALLKIISLIIDSKNPKLELDVLIRVYSLPLRENQSDARIARIHGISRQAFSIRVLDMCEMLNVRPPRNLKSSDAVDEYELTNSSQHKVPDDE